MRRRGLLIAGAGAVIFGISFLVANSIVESDLLGPGAPDVSSIFESMFDTVTDEIRVAPGESVQVPYEIRVSDEPILWAVQILDYRPGDSLLITISDVFGDEHGRFVQKAEVKMDIVAASQDADTLRFFIMNTGDTTLSAVAMFVEEPDSEMFDSDSPIMSMMVTLAVSAFMLVIGLIVIVIGTAIFLIDLRRQQKMRQDDWPGY